MKAFVRKLLLFLIPLLIVVIALELWARDNEYQVKGRYAMAHQQEVELMLLGSSQLHQAVHPDYQERVLAPLAFGGATMDFRVQLFHNFVEQFPNLKYVMIEASAYDLEMRTPLQSLKRHLYWVHFGMDTYQGKPPLKDYFLLTANPKAHLKRAKNFRFRKPTYTEHGFPLKYAYARDQFEIVGYDTAQVRAQALALFFPRLKPISKDRLSVLKKNGQELAEVLKVCQTKGLKVIFISPPKYHLANDWMHKLSKPKIMRRDSLITAWQRPEEVYFWDFEDWHADDPTYFREANHMSIKGATAFSVFINGKLNEIEAANID